jgi:uncharacterized Tic20 family protein/DNA-directed RNA polymerase subunit RPC12/RpoP
MPMEIVCPSCAAKLKAPEKLIGQVVKCPRCTTRVMVQAPPSALPTAIAATPRNGVATAAPPREDFLDELPEVGDEEAVEEVVADDDDYLGRDFGERQARRRGRRRSFAPTKDECNSAMLLYVLAIFTGFIGPLIIWMMKREESKFVDHHGKQAMNFAFTFAIAMVCLVIVAIPVGIVTFGIGFFLIALLALGGRVGALIVEITSAMKASRGEWSEIGPAIKFFR